MEENVINEKMYILTLSVQSTMSFLKKFSLFVLVIPSIYTSAQSCNTTDRFNHKWFGSDCQYKCHCKKDLACNVTNGDCPNGCDIGWFGPACQYGDIAKNITMNPKSFTSQEVEIILDGDDSTCLRRTILSLDVTWDLPFYFTWLRIVTGNSDELQKGNITIDIPDNVTIQEQECVSIVDDKTTDVHCNLSRVINKITLNVSAVGNVCSLYVSKGRNCALRQSTNQTTTQSDSINFVSSNAVDGNPNYNQNSCTHTDASSDQTPKWTVVLNHSVTVHTYTIYNRVGSGDSTYCCSNRLKGFILKTFDNQNEIIQNFTDSLMESQEVYNILPTDPLLQISKVEIEATYFDLNNDNFKTKLLTLCEVEIFGDSTCPNNTYGRDCENLCNCHVPREKCFVSTGNCPSGCKTGFYGQGCKKTCEYGYFGIDCKSNCSSCLQCDEVNGSCVSCASVGKKLPNCTDDCNPGLYGVDCKSNCSENCSGDGTVCDVINGNCKACKPGSYGDKCNLTCPQNCEICQLNSGNCTSCDSGYYGPNCIPCPNNCKYCDFNHGSCLGCSEGFQGSFCNETCSNFTYGENCANNCSTNCSDNLTEVRICHIVNGSCISGCKFGLEATNCSKFTLASVSDDDDVKIIIGAVVGSVCGFIAGVLVIVGFVVLWRRQKRSNKLEGTRPTSIIDNVNLTASLDTVTSSCQLENRENKHTAIKPPVPKKPKILHGKVEKTSEEKGTGYYNTVNLQASNSSTTIKLSNLHGYLVTHSKDFLHEQFNNLPVNTEATMMVGLSEKNKNKNRYKNICAYDHSRVHLEADPKKMHGDYINASYLKGYKDEEKFIASQGPTKIILNDFIRMIWEQKVEKVVMLTRLIEEGKINCEAYWPDEDEAMFGEIRVTLAATQVFSDYIIRRLQLYVDSQAMHPVTQFHFTSWPDKGVPDNPWALVDFEQRVAATATKRPIVVHCSAGVGRTGTFIALRNVMRQAEDTQQMDFFNTVAKLRQDRTMMIQTAEQYIFLHEAAKVAMTCINTTITSNNIAARVQQLGRKSVSGKTEMEVEFNSVCSMSEDNNQTTDDEGSAGVMYQNSRTVSNKLKKQIW